MTTLAPHPLRLRHPRAHAILSGSVAVFFLLPFASPEAAAEAFTFLPGALTYSENFDSMGATGTSLVTGWVSTDATIAVGNTSTSGSVYNVGATGDGDRAIGSLGSGSLLSATYGTSLLNSTGSFIGSFSLSGFMEQWRTGSSTTGNAGPETLPFEFSLNATSLTDGTWTSLADFNLVEKLTTTTAAAAINGNDAANRTALSAAATVAWADGVRLWIRWTETDSAGSDGLYAIDDFSITVVTTAPPRDLIWNPPASLWDTAATNWLNGVTATAFTSGDNVNFTQAGITAGGQDVTVDAGGLTPGNINVSNTSGTYTLSGGPLSGTGTLTKTDGGTLILGSTYSNAVVINGGTVRLQSSDRLADNAGIAISEGATLDLNGFDDTIGALSVTGGTVTTGPGFLIMGGNISTTASALTAAIEGNLNTGGAIRSITAADGPATTDLQIDAAISGSTRLTFNGPGLIALNGDNVGHTGGFTVASGATPANLSVGHYNALGSGQIFLNGGTINIATALTSPIPTAVSLGGNATLTGTSAEWSGLWTFAFNGAQNRTLTIENATVFSGDVSGADDTLNLLGTGSVDFTGLGNALATLNLNGPSVAIDGSLTGAVVVAAGTLNGTGVITGPVTIGDSVTPSDAILTLATTTISSFTTGGLTLNSDATFTLEISTNPATPGVDTLISTGAVSLGTGIASLNLLELDSGLLPLGTEFTLIDNQSLLGTTGYFLGLPEGSLFTVGSNQFEIHYGAGIDANDVVLLAAVPEPCSLATLLLGAGGLLGFRRHRRAAAAQAHSSLP